MYHIWKLLFLYLFDMYQIWFIPESFKNQKLKFWLCSYTNSTHYSPIATVPEVHPTQYKSFAVNDMRIAGSMRTFTNLKCPPLLACVKKTIHSLRSVLFYYKQLNMDI